MHDAKIEEMVQVNLSEYKADGGRVGFGDGTSNLGTQSDFNEFLKQMKESSKEHSLDQLMQNYKQWYKQQTGPEVKEAADGGRIGLAFGDTAQAAGIMGNLPVRQNKAGINELDLRETGGFIPPVGVKEKADDVPAMLSNNEFVWTADAVRAAGGGSVNKGAQILHDQMKQLESRVV